MRAGIVLYAQIFIAVPVLYPYISRCKIPLQIKFLPDFTLKALLDYLRAVRLRMLLDRHILIALSVLEIIWA